MAQTKSASSGSASRPRRSSPASSGGKSAAGSRSRSGSNGESGSSASQATSGAERTASQVSDNGADASQGVTGALGSAGKSVAKNIAFPVASAMAGAAAAMALGQRNTKRPKKVLGVSIPGTGGGHDGLAKNVGEVAKQIGRLADEVRTGRQKAEEIGKALR